MLADIHDSACASVFIPTHPSGEEVLRAQDALLLKNQVKEIKNSLKAKGLSESSIEDFLMPVKKLIDDKEFWRHQSEGLAVFLSNNFFRKYEVPLKLEPYSYVSHEFFLKPLVPLFNNDLKFFLLGLELENLKFYEGSRSGLTEKAIENFVPSRLEEVVGFDYEQKSLQFRSQHEGHGQSVFHGHGEGKDEKKTEIKRYLREIDKGLKKLLNAQQDPLVVACVDYLFPIYKEINTYKHLYPEHISGNPSLPDINTLHSKAWELLKPLTNKTKMEKAEIFRQFQGTARTANSIDEIVPAALHGKIDTLFLQKDEDAFGVYSKKTNTVETEKGGKEAEVSLFNMAAVHAYLHGADVFLMEKEEMPDGFSTINALFRY